MRGYDKNIGDYMGMEIWWGYNEGWMISWEYDGDVTGYNMMRI
jgi:hypothetical protein